MSSPYYAEIILVGFNYAPVGYAFCHGQLLPISQNEALFQLIGTTYGGDGQTTFGLPDLRGRVPAGVGQGPGLQSYFLGEVGGSETTTLTVQQMAAHTHTVDSSAFTATARCRNGPGNQQTPVGNVHANEAAGVTMPYSSATPNAAMSGSPAIAGGATAAAAGGNQPHDNMQPFLVLNYCICLSGVFPSQS